MCEHLYESLMETKLKFELSCTSNRQREALSFSQWHGLAAGSTQVTGLGREGPARCQGRDVSTEGQLSSAATCCHSTRGSQFAVSHFVSRVKPFSVSGHWGLLCWQTFLAGTAAPFGQVRAGEQLLHLEVVLGITRGSEWYCFIKSSGTRWGI